MTPRQARRERREADRKAKKLELKKSRLSDPASPPAAEAYPEIQPPAASSESATSRHGFVSQNRHLFSTRAEINRANAQLSTGPRTHAGNLASSRNSMQHGLASGQVIIEGEDSAAFDSLLHDFREEHQPATWTEELLVKEMAQSYWLTQRAIALQNHCFTDQGINEKQLALFLRYQTTHERAFYKALNTLLKLKKQHHQNQIGFVSQKRSAAATAVGFVSQPSIETSPDAQFVRQNPICDRNEAAPELSNATRAA